MQTGKVPRELHGQWNLHEMNHKKIHEFVDSTGFNPYSEGFFIVGPISAPLASALQCIEVAIETAEYDPLPSLRALWITKSCIYQQSYTYMCIHGCTHICTFIFTHAHYI